MNFITYDNNPITVTQKWSPLSYDHLPSMLGAQERKHFPPIVEQQ